MLPLRARARQANDETKAKRAETEMNGQMGRDKDDGQTGQEARRWSDRLRIRRRFGQNLTKSQMGWFFKVNQNHFESWGRKSSAKRVHWCRRHQNRSWNELFEEWWCSVYFQQSSKKTKKNEERERGVKEGKMKETDNFNEDRRELSGEIDWRKGIQGNNCTLTSCTIRPRLIRVLSSWDWTICT